MSWGEPAPGHARLTYLFWEATPGCNLACRHCGSDCHRSRDTSLGLTTSEAVEMFRQVKRDFDSRDVFVAVTGGEPLLRSDLFEVMGEARRLGFHWGMVTNGWHADAAVVENCRRTGMRTIAISLDGASAASHDWLRGGGSFDRAVAPNGLHRSTSSIEQVASEIRRLGFVFDDMGEGRLADCARNVRPFRGPIPECAAESAGGDVIVPETTQEHQKHHVG